MVFSYSENLIKCATDALKKPEDFGYWGPEDTFITWGFCGIDENRDSGCLGKSNFHTVSQDLINRFPEDFRIESYRHWLVGQVTRLVCRVLHHEGEITDGNITEAFKAAMEWQDKLSDYPVADEDHYSQLQDELRLEEVKRHSMAKMAVTDDDDWAESVLSNIYDDGIYWDPDIEGIDDESMLIGIYKAHLWSPEYPEEWFDFADRNELERPPFTTESISRWNKNQLKLFES
jgi:hypothetical protein